MPEGTILTPISSQVIEKPLDSVTTSRLVSSPVDVVSEMLWENDDGQSAGEDDHTLGTDDEAIMWKPL